MATNVAVIEGNLGRDPEMKFTPNGTSVVKLSLAHNRKYNGNEYTSWFNVVCWRKLADIVVEYLKKGSHINVTARLESRTWDSDNGKRYTVDLIANDISFLDPKSGKTVQASEETPAEGETVPEDEPPF